MRRKGTIRKWNDDRGFGFITPTEGGKDVFLHVSAFSNRGRRPEVGQMVTYALSRDAKGRPRASKATLPGERIAQTKKASGTTGAVITASGFLVLVAALAVLGKIPAIIFLAYLLVSLVTYFVYAYDKTAAKDGAWRTKEGTLHWLALLGGWPGALVAQQVFRHKTSKQSFRLVFWLTVFVNVGALGWVMTPEGSDVVKTWLGSA